MTSNALHCLDISEDVLDGIHPHIIPKSENYKNDKKSEGGEKYHGIPADILDGIHQKVQSLKLSTEAIKTRKPAA